VGCPNVGPESQTSVSRNVNCKVPNKSIHSRSLRQNSPALIPAFASTVVIHDDDKDHWDHAFEYCLGHVRILQFCEGTGPTKDSFFPFTESYRVSGKSLEIVHDKNGGGDTIVGIATA
jgi:hypothetical protein